MNKSRGARADLQLESFKTSINLSEYAAHYSYVLDKKNSSHNSVAMRHSNGDKIIIAIGEDGHWIYFSVRDDADNGSIIDFVQKRRGCNLGAVRQELNGWLPGRYPKCEYIKPHLFVQHIEPTTKSRINVMREYNRMTPLPKHHAYLEKKRKIPSAILQSIRFTGKIKTDEWRNTIFPHYDNNGICGFEKKNWNFTGFAKGGTKGLWFSAANKEDTTLVIVESGINAVSYHALNPDQHTRYTSTGGAMNENQPGLLLSAINKMPHNATIIAAMDQDNGGRKLATQIEEIFNQAGNERKFKRDLPPQEGTDWNDVLQFLSGG